MPGFIFIRLNVNNWMQIGQRSPQLVFQIFRQPVRFHERVRVGDLHMDIHMPV